MGRAVVGFCIQRTVWVWHWELVCMGQAVFVFEATVARRVRLVLGINVVEIVQVGVADFKAVLTLDVWPALPEAYKYALT